MGYPGFFAYPSCCWNGGSRTQQFDMCRTCINTRPALKHSVDHRAWIGFFGVNVLCGLAVNSFNPERFVGKLFHYLGSLLMIVLGVFLIFIGRSKSIFHTVETIPKLGLMTGIVMQIVNTKQWMVIFSLMTVMLASFASEPGGIPGGVAGTLVLATINTTFGLCSMTVWTYIGYHLQGRISNPKNLRVAVFGLVVLLLILSLLMLLRYHFA